MSSSYAQKSRNAAHGAAKPSSNMQSDDTLSSPFGDDEDYVVVSTQTYNDTPPHRPSLATSDCQFAEPDRSCFSHDALISSSDQLSGYSSYQYQPTIDAEPRPLTLNELKPVERAALVRQSRKLNKILGTTPHIAETTQSSSPRSTPKKLQRRGTLAGSDIRLDRSASMAALNSPPLEPQPGSQWSKPTVSLVAQPFPPTANAKVPVLQLNVAPSSGQGVEAKRQRRLSDSSIASSLLGSTGPHRSGSGTMVARRAAPTDSFDDSQEITLSPKNIKNASGSKVYIPPSPTSPPYISDELRRQQTRARMAKLQQIMGESVPSELVMGTAANANKTRRRRLSMESPTTPTSAMAKSLKHKRSKSLWKKDVDDSLEFDSAPENSWKSHTKSKSQEMPPIEDLLLKQLRNPMNEKQKALNVKRALKMAAVFGVPPPQTLYRDIPGPASSDRSGTSGSRQSLASLAYMLDHDRDSLYDLLSNIEGSDSGSDDEPVEWPYERKPRSDSLPENGSKTQVGVAKFTTAGTHPDMSPPTPPFNGHSPADSRPVSPSSPLVVYSKSITTLVANENENRKQPSGTKPKRPSSALDRQFSARRRRAKKLSRFFGVEYNNLFNALVYDDGTANKQEPESERVPALLTDTVNAVTTDVAQNHIAGPALSSYRGMGQGGTVLVQTENGRKATVLRTSANVAADVDANDLGEVMARLRALKA